MPRCTCNQPSGHLPNCPMGSVRAAVEVGNLQPTKSEMQRSWYPKGPDGKPKPGNKLTPYEKALVLSNGDEKNIYYDRRGNCYAKKDKRKKS